jgi:hypothetical protein
LVTLLYTSASGLSVCFSSLVASFTRTVYRRPASVNVSRVIFWPFRGGSPLA